MAANRLVEEKGTVCPACGSAMVGKIAEYEKVEAVGLFFVMGFPQGIPSAGNDWRCKMCGHEW
jgi:predicted RNA-binding Zn-ribbon protein involved in translation (DUF1610 family)